jgi:predicted nucleic acid-binding protein
VKYVLDTNIVTRLLKGDERVLGHLADVEPSDVGIPLLVLAELLFGAEKVGSQGAKRRTHQADDRNLPDAAAGPRGRSKVRR